MTEGGEGGNRLTVAAGPRFLKCYDATAGLTGALPVAAGPRFLKCYDAPVPLEILRIVAAGPRFLYCSYGWGLNQIARASFREWVCSYVSIMVMSGSFNKITSNAILPYRSIPQ